MAVVATFAVVSARADEPAVGATAKPFELKTIDGGSVSLADVTKDGPATIVVLRGFPGYQCPICTKQVAAFRGKADAFRDAGVRVLMIYPGPADNLMAHAKEFVGDGALPDGFTLAIDPDYAFTNAYGLRWDAPKETAYPSTFVVDQGGTVRFAKISKTHGDRAAPEAALAAAKKASTTRPTK